MIIYNDTFYCSYSSSIHQLYTVDTAIIQNVYDQEGKHILSGIINGVIILLLLALYLFYKKK